MNMNDENKILRSEVLRLQNEREAQNTALTEKCDKKKAALCARTQQLLRLLKQRWTTGGVVLVILFLVSLGAALVYVLLQRCHTGV